MKKLFEDQSSNFDFISLKRLADCCLENGPERIELAGFQRGAAWKAANVEALWDSLLRWFPIGSIMLARSEEFKDAKSRDLQLSSSADTTKINQLNEPGDLYILVDGQQRSNAIALGFLPWGPKSKEAGARLWIDLSEPIDKSKNHYDFYLCTRDEPFGEGVTVPQKREALKTIGKSGKDDSEINLDETYPVRAKQPVPFAEFVEAIRSEKSWEKIKLRLLNEEFINLALPAREYIQKNLQNTPRRDIQELIRTVQNVIVEGKYLIPAILFQNKENRVSSDELFKLFERININGVTPPQVELFFSALKLKWPEIGDAVAEINKQEELKGLLRPTDIILAALRMLKPEFTDLSRDSFERFIAQDKALEGLRSLLDGKESLLLCCMRWAYHALHYDEARPDDYGLPRQLVLRLRPRVWQTILIWIYQHQPSNGTEVSEKNRFEMVRFALLDAMDYFIFVNWRRGYSSYINSSLFLRLLTEGIEGVDAFSAQKIFLKVQDRAINDGWSKEDSPLHLFKPEEYKSWIELKNTKTEINWRSHYIGNVCLLFAQRKFLHTWENLNDLDVDHIIPYSWMSFSGRSVSQTFWKFDTAGLDARSPVINSPGNYRFWPATLNRQYQDGKPKEKHIHADIANELDGNHVERGLHTVKDVLDASFIDQEFLNLEQEMEIEKEKEKAGFRVWTDSTYRKLETLVNQRSYKMYANLHDTLRLSELEKGTDGARPEPFSNSTR